ncbi:MAG: hypothetical protein LBH88_02045 [Candidatus Methanoplasma sp.]|jgi:spore coat protein U-like protein|nr:hypothetical protein [Candidatus Methanoplasma sp.]
MDNSTLKSSFGRILDVDNEVYSTRMAAVFCLVLSAVLWWIPVLGPAVAGYACGRKTGSMVKGMVCSLVSGAVLLLVIWGLSVIVLGHGGYPDIPADEAASSLTGIVGATAAYLQTFFTEGTSSLNILNLGVVTAFGAVGGILSRQVRKETAYLISLGATEGSARPTSRSMQMYGRNKELGFESFDDCTASQRMMTNVNRETGAERSEGKEKITKVPERKPAVTTVQTVTTTVSGSDASPRNRETESPFSDILDRPDRR